MHRRLLCIAFTLLTILMFRAPTFARVIGVGPQREAATLDAALARAKVGDEIVLARGIEHLTDGVKITIDAIEIRSEVGAGEPATLRNTSADKWAVTIDHRAEGLNLRDLIMTGGGNVTCIRGRGRRLSVDDVHPTASVWRFMFLDGAQRTTVRNCTAPLLNDYTVCAFDGGARDLVIDRCTFGGSTDEHCVRLQNVHEALLRDSTFHAGGKKSALTIRQGENVRVENCTINGPIIIGPLADGDGGINLPADTPEQRAKREAALRRFSVNYTLKNCTIDTSGITVEMGVQDLTLDACWIRTSRQWAVRLNRDQYEPWRNVPTGRLVNCELTGPEGLRAFERARPDFHVIGTVINGERVADTAEPTTQPQSGGAVPGEVPATQPAEQAHARRAEVMAALQRLELVMAELQLARAGLHASTQPAPRAR